MGTAVFEYKHKRKPNAFVEVEPRRGRQGIVQKLQHKRADTSLTQAPNKIHLYRANPQVIFFASLFGNKISMFLHVHVDAAPDVCIWTSPRDNVKNINYGIRSPSAPPPPPPLESPNTRNNYLRLRDGGRQSPRKCCLSHITMASMTGGEQLRPLPQKHNTCTPTNYATPPPPPGFSSIKVQQDPRSHQARPSTPVQHNISRTASATHKTATSFLGRG